ncbi:MAG TPA: hypothetical protein VFL59_07815 [Candidatus Nanopelagicales bacterium]|nr:hypothetical protein [Candidatus Nanopelagicales bacterium]
MTDPYDEPRAGAEAARLLAAAQGWLRSAAPHLAPVGDDGATCPCPVCRAIAGVRDADPESVGRWVDTAVAAATTVLAQAGERLAPPEPAASDTDSGPTPDDDADLGDPAGDASGTQEPRAPQAGQDEESARGVRRIPLEQTEPGDLDG